MDSSFIVIIIISFLVITLIILLRGKKSTTESGNSENNLNKIQGDLQYKIKSLESELDNLKSSKHNQALSTLTQNQIDEIANQIANQKFERWKKEYEEEIRTDSKIRQKGKIISSIDAQMMPLLGIGHFPGKFYEARFIGNPVTYIVFKNLNEEDKPLEIVFVEITNKNVMKAGRVRKAIRDGFVTFVAIEKKE